MASGKRKGASAGDVPTRRNAQLALIDGVLEVSTTRLAAHLLDRLPGTWGTAGKARGERPETLAKNISSTASETAPQRRKALQGLNLLRIGTAGFEPATP